MVALLFGSDDQHLLSIWRINHGDALAGHLLDVGMLARDSTAAHDRVVTRVDVVALEAGEETVKLPFRLQLQEEIDCWGQITMIRPEILG